MRNKFEKGNKFAFKKGFAPWNKGKKLSEEHKKSLSISHIGITTSRKGKKVDRNLYPNMGHFIKHSEETKNKVSLSKLGKPSPNKGKKYMRHIILNSKYTENYRQRRLFQKLIQRQVLSRDNWTCQMCFKRGGILHVDHIQPFSEYVEGRFKMENCRTLCRECHYLVTFGRPMPKNSKWGKTFMPLNSNINFEEKGW